MDRILERYERYSYAERELVTTELDPQGNWSLEYTKLKAKIEILQKNQRHFMGEDLETMSLKELQNLEQQLDTALKQIRSRKQNFPRTVEALILHMLSPLAAEVLTRKFEEMDQRTRKEDRDELYLVFYGVFDDQSAAMDAILNGKVAFARQVILSFI